MGLDRVLADDEVGLAIAMLAVIADVAVLIGDTTGSI